MAEAWPPYMTFVEALRYSRIPRRRLELVVEKLDGMFSGGKDCRTVDHPKEDKQNVPR
jgi:hypothetical protein